MKRLRDITFIILVLLINSARSQNTTTPSIKMVIQDNHYDRISSINYSPNGKYILTRSFDGKIKLWNKYGFILRTIQGAEGNLGKAIFSSDSKNIITFGNASNTITIYRLDGSIKNTFDIPGTIFDIGIIQDTIILSKVITTNYENKLYAYSPTGKLLGSFNDVVNFNTSPDLKSLIIYSNQQLKWVEFKNWKNLLTISDPNFGKAQISANNKYIVGYSLHEIKVWDNLGKLKHRIKQKTYPGVNFIDHLILSPDEKHIIVLAHYINYSNKENSYIDILSLEDGEKKRTIETNSEEWIQYLAISPDSRTISTVADNQKYNGILRTWDLDGNLLYSVQKEGTQFIDKPIFTKEGKEIAMVVNSSFRSTLKIWSMEGEMVINIPFSESVNAFSVSSDGKFIAIGCENSKENRYYIKITDSGGKEIKKLKGHQSNVMSLEFTNNGKTLISSSLDGSIKIWDVNNEKCIKTIPITEIFNLKGLSYPRGFNIAKSINEKMFVAFCRNCDNGKFQLFYIDNDSVQTFPIQKKSVIDIVFCKDNQKLASISEDDSLKIWNINGKLIKTFKANCISPDFKTVAYIKDSSILIYNGDNGTLEKKHKRFTGEKDVRLFANQEFYFFNPNGKLILCTSQSGAMEIINIETGSSTIYYSNGKEWITYTPDGYFDASKDAGNIILMVFDNNSFAIDQFALIYNRPDVILKNLGSMDHSLINYYYKLYQKRLKKIGIIENQFASDFSVPTVEITNIQQEGKFVTLTFSCNSEKYDLKRYNIFINNVPIFGSYGKNIDGKSLFLSEKVELTKGKNKIEISCTNEKGIESYRALSIVNYFDDTKGDLYFLGFGVSKYQNPELNLNYADKDASDLAKIFEKLYKKGFKNYYSKVLINEQVTPEAIRNAKEFIKNAKADDTFVLFIAGHGKHDDDAEATYYFLTSNTDLNNLKTSAIDFSTIEELLQGIPPRNKLFLLDACESGEIDDEQDQILANITAKGVNSRGFKATTTSTISPTSKTRSFLYRKDRYIYQDLTRRSGAIVFSSSKGGELSFEQSDIENGLFTENIIEALTTNNADSNKDGFLTIDELRDYVSNQVAKESNDLQHPTVDRDNIYLKFGFFIK